MDLKGLLSGDDDDESQGVSIEVTAETIDPDGIANAKREKLAAEKGDFWARKVVTLGGIQTVSMALGYRGDERMKLLVDALARTYAADLIMDLKEHYPDRDVGEMTNELVVDSKGLVETVTGLAGELLDKLHVMADAPAMKH